MKKIKNFTPHEVVLMGENGKVLITFPAEGLIRLSEKRERLETLFLENVKISVFKKVYGGTEELPPKRKGTYYIVSLPVAQAFPERTDFLIPDELVRDENGKIIGCRSFARIGGGKK